MVKYLAAIAYMVIAILVCTVFTVAFIINAISADNVVALAFGFVFVIATFTLILAFVNAMRSDS